MIKPEYNRDTLFFEIPEDSIDINVHPTKTEVKFENESFLYAILNSSVRHSLGKFNVIPNIDFSNDINLSNLSSESDIKPPNISFSSDFNPFSDIEVNIDDENEKMMTDCLIQILIIFLRTVILITHMIIFLFQINTLSQKQNQILF